MMMNPLRKCCTEAASIPTAHAALRFAPTVITLRRTAKNDGRLSREPMWVLKNSYQPAFFFAF